MGKSFLFPATFASSREIVPLPKCGANPEPVWHVNCIQNGMGLNTVVNC